MLDIRLKNRVKNEDINNRTKLIDVIQHEQRKSNLQTLSGIGLNWTEMAQDKKLWSNTG